MGAYGLRAAMLAGLGLMAAGEAAAQAAQTPETVRTQNAQDPDTELEGGVVTGSY